MAIHIECLAEPGRSAYLPVGKSTALRIAHLVQWCPDILQQPGRLPEQFPGIVLCQLTHQPGEHGLEDIVQQKRVVLDRGFVACCHFESSLAPKHGSTPVHERLDAFRRILAG